MSNGYQQLVSSLENRYDYHSARVVAADDAKAKETA